MNEENSWKMITPKKPLSRPLPMSWFSRTDRDQLFLSFSPRSIILPKGKKRRTSSKDFFRLQRAAKKKKLCRDREGRKKIAPGQKVGKKHTQDAIFFPGESQEVVDVQDVSRRGAPIYSAKLQSAADAFPHSHFSFSSPPHSIITGWRRC